MKLAELQLALRAADARAVLVPPPILDQIIQEACDLRGSVWSTPHRKCYVADRQTLFRHVDQAYLALAPDQLLPDRVILLSDPPAEELSDLESKVVLLKYWRRLFHASVHVAYEADRLTPGTGLSAEQVRLRITEIGRAEFEEIRTVLIQDHYLLPNADDRTTYAEFAAVYLETRYFAGSLLTGLFPGLRDFARVDEMLAREVDSASLFARTRLAGAPDPVAPIDTGSEEPESQERYWALVRAAERASLASNLVRAAILRVRAWRIAPAALGQGTRDEALADMRRLAARLAKSLGLSPEEAVDWGKNLPLLLDKADQGDRPAEAKLLYDLQKVSADDERDIYALDVVEWLLSAGKRPIKRPLPSLRLVRIARNLRGVTRHLGVVRLSDVDRQHFTTLVQDALTRTEQAVRDRFGPVLTTALQDVGLNPSNPPERVALSKMVAEWLDRIIGYGFLTFSDLRDALSRNQLKLPDLSDPRDLMRGDPLLRLDRRLASLLDGVYKPSDVYMRWLEQLTAVNFGTGIGRAITRWVTIPFVGAWLFLQAMGILVHLLLAPDRHRVSGWLYLVLVGPSRSAPAAGNTLRLVWHFLLLFAATGFVMALLHSPTVRQRCRQALTTTGRFLRHTLIDVPVAFLRRAPLQELIKSWYFQLLWWYLLRPLLVVLPLWLVLPKSVHTRGAAVVVFLAAAVLLNSRMGEAITAAFAQAAKTLVAQFRAGFLAGLYRFIMRVFKQILDTGELLLFTVDDWLRYRKGDSRASLVVRTILGVMWFPVAYLARFYMLVLIEPGFNPAKAPVSYLAAKVMLPLSLPLTKSLVNGVQPLLPEWLAFALVIPTVWLLPDAFGFLFWETKENWRLYRANRRRAVQPIAVGPHGETVKDLLQPGFHSGTVPRLYRRLRTAEREAYRTRNWANARACRQELEEVSRSLQRFVLRDLLAMLDQVPAWQNQPLRLGELRLAVNRIDLELLHPGYPDAPVRIDFEFRAGSLLARLCDPGWLDRIAAGQVHAFAMILASVYKLAGVDLVREQIEANLPTPAATWDVTGEGLVIEPGAGIPRLVYPVREHRLPALASHAEDLPPHPYAVDSAQLVFAHAPLYWHQWLEQLGRQRNDEDAVGPARGGTWDDRLIRRKADTTGPEVTGADVTGAEVAGAGHNLRAEATPKPTGDDEDTGHPATLGSESFRPTIDLPTRAQAG